MGRTDIARIFPALGCVETALVTNSGVYIQPLMSKLRPILPRFNPVEHSMMYRGIVGLSRRSTPTVNIIDIGAILKQVKRLLDLVGLALNLVFGFTLAAGSVALYSVISVLENFEPPAFDDDRREELSEYVQRRKREIGTREM